MDETPHSYSVFGSPDSSNQSHPNLAPNLRKAFGLRLQFMPSVTRSFHLGHVLLWINPGLDSIPFLPKIRVQLAYETLYTGSVSIIQPHPRLQRPGYTAAPHQE